MITGDEIDFIFSDLTERREVEFKQSVNWNTDAMKVKIAKSVMAFSNIRNGGWLVIGVRQNENHTYSPVGMSEEDYASFNIDNVLAYINARAEPPVNIEIKKEIKKLENSQGRFIIFKIYEFEDYPIFCKDDGGITFEHKGVRSTFLHKGVLYTRSRRTYESAPIQNQSDMKEIVDMILTKYSQEFARRFRKITEIEESGEEQFIQELGGV